MVEVDQESRQHAIGLIQSASLSQTKFAAETVLKGAPQTFNAAFGLGRVGRDLLDTEFFQSAAHLGGKLLSGEFFLARPMGIIALKDAMAITIEAQGNAVGGEQGVQTAKIAGGIFRF